MKYTLHFVTLLSIIIAFLYTPIFAQTSYQNFIFGFGISGGINDVWHLSGSEEGKTVKWKPGISVGGGLLLENMFSSVFGIHSGLFYTYHQNKLKFGNTPDEKLVNNNHSFTIPLYLISSFGKKLRFDFLYGLNYMHIFYNTMSNNHNSTTGIKYINYNLFGCGLQLRLAIPFDRFTYIYVGPHGLFYFSNVIESTNWRDYLYSIQLDIGMLFKTF
ncbi:MAG: hypothetical protein N3F66_14520 [Spirochaetes bacterium]|nr:hypothetical protein [Spirochaetota bacterium]